MRVQFPSGHEGESAIQVSVNSEGDLQSLIEALTRLADGQDDEVDLSELDTTFDGLSRVTLHAGSQEHVLLREGACEWTCTPANWALAMTMLQALWRAGEGFQNMPPDLAEGLCVEVSYRGPANPEAGRGLFRDDAVDER